MLLPIAPFGILAYLSMLSSIVSAQTPYSAPLPIVDLGYELHQAIAFNTTGNYYNFSNVRFAAAPVGNLRFRLPKAPGIDRGTVQDGSVPRICPQALPSWTLSTGWIAQYLTGQAITLNQSTLTALNDSLTAANVGELYPQPDYVTEDCLFLDVMVPKTIFDKGLKNKSGSAVMVWIYGGGYTLGYKTQYGNPAGLLERSMTHGRNGVIYVAINYRLGAFGFLAGSTVQADGVANAALYDQRMALEWVQQYIHLFGGDPERVTVFGESAGGGSIMHQITAYGGAGGSVPFAQAIPQSPGFFPQPSCTDLESQYTTLLSYANVTSLSALRDLSSADLITANTLQVWRSHYGQFTYGPAVDGSFVPSLPGILLLDGKFDKNVRIMLGHNLDEGLDFANPLVQTQDEFVANTAGLIDLATPEVVDYVTNTLYPPVYNGSYGYMDAIGRSALLLSEWIFTCNTNYMARAKKGKAYSYYFTVPPGLHGTDVAYTFYNNGPSTTTVLNTTVAVILQDWLTTFAESGVPKTPDVAGLPKFVMYGNDATVLELSLSEVEQVPDPASNARCTWWQKGEYV